MVIQNVEMPLYWESIWRGVGVKISIKVVFFLKDKNLSVIYENIGMLTFYTFHEPY